jgi:hypothetical protein
MFERDIPLFEETKEYREQELEEPGFESDTPE